MEYCRFSLAIQRTVSISRQRYPDGRQSYRHDGAFFSESAQEAERAGNVDECSIADRAQRRRLFHMPGILRALKLMPP